MIHTSTGAALLNEDDGQAGDGFEHFGQQYRGWRQKHGARARAHVAHEENEDGIVGSQQQQTHCLHKTIGACREKTDGVGDVNLGQLQYNFIG